MLQTIYDAVKYNSDSSSTHKSTQGIGKKNFFSLQVLKLISRFVTYKYLCTIPAISVSCERSFSKFELLIKTRFRSIIHQNRLESLLLHSCEKDIGINLKETINQYALLKKLVKQCIFIYIYFFCLINNEYNSM